jgi:hypothetical protein
MGYIYLGTKISKKRLLVSTQATLKKIKIPKTVPQGGLPSLFCDLFILTFRVIFAYRINITNVRHPTSEILLFLPTSGFCPTKSPQKLTEQTQYFLTSMNPRFFLTKGLKGLRKEKARFSLSGLGV